MTTPTYHPAADWLKRPQLSQADKCRAEGARHPAFTGEKYVAGRPSNWRQLSDSEKRQWRNRQAMTVVEPIDLARLKRQCCAGRTLMCSSLEGRTCWKYDVDNLAISNGKPLRCRECLRKCGTL